MTHASYDELKRIIHSVRSRWRLKVALRGAAVVLAAGLVAFALSAYAMEHFRYDGWAVTVFRLLAYLSVVALAVRFLVLPLRGRVSDERVALYIEEHEPSLQAALLSAVRTGGKGPVEDRPDLSRALVERLVQVAIEKCQPIDYGRQVERDGLRRSSALLAAVALAGLVLAVLSPAFLRHAAPFLFAPWSVRAASPFLIEVEPGNATVPRGGNQTVTARLSGFDAETVELAVRSGQGPDWKRWPMTADEAARGFRFVLFGLDAGTDYFVESNGVRSPLFHIDVADIPYVKRVDLEYRFPAYTGLSPQVQENTADVVALRGTEVRLRVTPTMKVAAGRLNVDGVPPEAMTVEADGTLTASFKVQKDGFYRIQLPGRDGALKPGSPDYTIDVLADQPPTITLLKPGRDAKVTAIEEVFTELKAEDDYGVARAELVYSVNGAPEKTLVVHKGPSKKLLTTGHTFFLEELKLEPGDFISYFARATDESASPQTSTTDIYFMEVRPFGKEYHQAEQRGGGAGGGGGADGALSFQQRQIIAATFKLVRDRARTADKQFGEDVATLALVQGRLKDQVDSLVQRMANRGIADPGSEWEKTAQSLRAAAEEMTTARGQLDGKKAKEALPPEQGALKHLQRAEAAFRNVQVSFEQRGGGGGGSAMNAEDLADLFELELDKLKNQYETVQRGQQEQADNQVDEALERLKELARRQEQENERLRRLGARAPNQGGGGGGSQRQLAEEAEDLARQLERLAREKSSPALQETARRLQDAVNAMRRSGSGSQTSMGESAAALDRLRDARRALENSRSGRLERDMEDAQRKANELAEAQGKIAAEAEEMTRQGGSQGASGNGRMERLLERKDALAGQVADLEAQLDRMARDSRKDKKDASRKLQEAADAIRDDKLKEKIRYSKGVLRARAAEQARQLESEIGSGIADLGKSLKEAAGSTGRSDDEKKTAALDKMRDLVRNMESIQERLQERGNGAGTEQDGKPGTRAGSRDGSARDGSQNGSSRDRSARDGSARDGSQNGSSRDGSQSGSQNGSSRDGSSADGSQNGSSRDGGSRDGSSRGGSDGSRNGGSWFQGPWGGGGPAPGSPRLGEDWRPGSTRALGPEEARQLQRELRERLQEAEALGRQLGPNGARRDLQDVLRDLKRLQGEQVFREPRGLAQLMASVIEGLKSVEFTLRREVEGPDRDKLFLSGSQDLPPGWQSLVEEYYRSLSKKTTE